MRGEVEDCAIWERVPRTEPFKTGEILHGGRHDVYRCKVKKVEKYEIGRKGGKKDMKRAEKVRKGLKKTRGQVAAKPLTRRIPRKPRAGVSNTATFTRIINLRKHEI